ncbi:hypothetical protein BIW11_11750 [Tropilaelaps mercedesae]|uniref:Uncharacterized protein n=1 Tax=Tropilaelaps mercedesae TaxID=418985 RepID=A0A1V9X9L7_9ACAR|nr:hypothetical protein BIW11_11750 [Tropilaelaps mercedesae]
MMVYSKKLYWQFKQKCHLAELKKCRPPRRLSDVVLRVIQVIGEEAVEESMRNLTEQAYGNLQHSLVSHARHTSSPFALSGVRTANFLGGSSKASLPWLDSANDTVQTSQQQQQQQQLNSADAHKNMLLNFAAAMASYSALGQQSTDGGDGFLVDEPDSSDETSQQLSLQLPNHLSALGHFSNHLVNQGQLPAHMARLAQLSPQALPSVASPDDLRPQTNSPSSSGGRAGSSPDARFSLSQHRVAVAHVLGALGAVGQHHQGLKRKSSQTLDNVDEDDSDAEDFQNGDDDDDDNQGRGTIPKDSHRQSVRNEANAEFVKALRAIQKVAGQLHEAQQFQQRLLLLKLQFLQERRHQLHDGENKAQQMVDGSPTAVESTLSNERS